MQCRFDVSTTFPKECRPSHISSGCSSISDIFSSFRLASCDAAGGFSVYIAVLASVSRIWPRSVVLFTYCPIFSRFWIQTLCVIHISPNGSSFIHQCGTASRLPVSVILFSSCQIHFRPGNLLFRYFWYLLPELNHSLCQWYHSNATKTPTYYSSFRSHADGFVPSSFSFSTIC